MGGNNAHGNVVDLKTLSRTRLTPPPAALLPQVRRYPAEAPTRVFATAPTSTHHVTPTTLFALRQSLFSRMLTAILIPLLFVQSVGRAYADEVVVEESPVVVAEEAAPTPQTEVAPAVEVIPADISTQPSDAPIDEIVEATPVVVETSNTPPVENIPTTPPSEIPPTSDTDTNTDTEGTTTDPLPTEDVPPPPTDESEVPPIGSSGGSEDPEGVSTTTDEEFVASTTEEVLDTETPLDETVSTTTEEIVDDNAPVEGELPVMEKSAAELADEEAFRTEQLRAKLRREVEQEFLRGCISFEASGYYCLNDGARKTSTASTTKIITTVESQQGVGGDKEIFVVRNGVRTPITANDWDDAFPSGDASGEQFVWQGMKGGRWQIFVGTLSASGTPTVVQLTDSRESNFNPKIDGNHVVWQGWADENWEIFIATRRDADSPFAGEHLPEGNALLNVGPEWAVERLTTNTEHDMFPSPHGDIVTWQSRDGDDWVVYAYSVSTQKEIQLSAPGSKGENPRFALTWEERDQDGRVRLVGYDIATGEKTDITSASLRLPVIPYRGDDEIPTTQSDPIALPPPPNVGGGTTPRGDDDDTGDPLL